MRIVNLDEKNNDRYKVVLSRKDWGKILLGINYYVGAIMIVIVFFGSIILYVFYKILYSKYYNLLVSLKWTLFYGSMFLFAGLILFLYYKLFTTVLRPFHFRGMVIDVVGKKIFLKNKMFSLKDTDTVVFYLEKNIEHNENTTKNNKKNEEKEKKSSNWVYYVKKTASSKPINKELSENGFLYNNFEEFIIHPMEIKYLEDFSLVLGKEGLLGVWRQIAKLLGVGFEEKIEFEEEILLQSNGGTTFSYKTSNEFSIDKESSSLLGEKEEDEKKMRDVLNLLKEKIEKKYPSGDTSWDSTDFVEYLLFKEELMGVRMFSTGFELRFWSEASEFPGKEPVINKKFVLTKLMRDIALAMIIFITLSLMFSQMIKDSFLIKIVMYLDSLFFSIFVIIPHLKDKIKNMRSREHLFRVMYLLQIPGLFLVIVISIITGLYENTLVFNISFLFSTFLLFVFIFFSVLGDLYSSYCPWNLTINRYMSRLVFSFEDKVLEGEYGFCVSRTHWQAPALKIRFLGLLEIGRSLFGSGDFLLAIKIDEDYVVLPLPKLEEDKIREILSFLQEVFTLLASYSLNNVG